MTSLKIAVLMNGFESPNTPLIRDSFTTAISSAATLASLPTPTITFYDPIILQTYPDPSVYDLIVLSGGTADPSGTDSWVLALQAYLRKTMSENPKQKLVGICWGHQTTNIVHGGLVDNMSGTSPEIGVHTIPLTSAGKKMFPFAAEREEVRIHEFHRREVKSPGKGMVKLMEGNQCFVNEGNTVMTFQGHPELNGNLARVFVETTPAYMGLDEEKEGELVRRAAGEHDGVRIWERILRWVGE